MSQVPEVSRRKTKYLINRVRTRYPAATTFLAIFIGDHYAARSDKFMKNESRFRRILPKILGLCGRVNAACFTFRRLIRG